MMLPGGRFFSATVFRSFSLEISVIPPVRRYCRCLPQEQHATYLTFKEYRSNHHKPSKSVLQITEQYFSNRPVSNFPKAALFLKKSWFMFGKKILRKGFHFLRSFFLLFSPYTKNLFLYNFTQASTYSRPRKPPQPHFCQCIDKGSRATVGIERSTRPGQLKSICTAVILYR